jgi:hypothetical protein
MPRAPKSKARQPRERRGDSNAKIQIDSTLGKRILAEVDAAREKYAGRPGDPIFEVGILRIMLADPSRFLLKEVDSDDYRY